MSLLLEGVAPAARQAMDLRHEGFIDLCFQDELATWRVGARWEGWRNFLGG
jgi:hypothetical protein